MSVENPLGGPISMKYDLLDNTEIDCYLATLTDDIPSNIKDVIIQAFSAPVAEDILMTKNYQRIQEQ